MTDRETLETLALEAICACWYYDLLDNLEITPDDELRAIIAKKTPCDHCGE
jgi:hypothetical protein